MKKRIFTSVVAIAAAMSLSVAAFAIDPGATNGSQSSDAVAVVADQETVMEGDKGMTITAPAGSFGDTVTSVKLVADVTATDNSAASAAVSAMEAVASTTVKVNTKLSITLEDQDGKNVQPNGNVTVTVAYDGVSNIVAYVDGSNVEFIALTVSADKKTASFETSHFSDYYLVEVAADQVDALVGKTGDGNAAGNTNQPTDDKNQPTGFALALVPAAVAAAAVVVSKKRK